MAKTILCRAIGGPGGIGATTGNVGQPNITVIADVGDTLYHGWLGGSGFTETYVNVFPYEDGHPGVPEYTGGPYVASHAVAGAGTFTAGGNGNDGQVSIVETGGTTVTFVTPGKYVYRVPSGITQLTVYCWAAGGGGGGGNQPLPNKNGGGGGTGGSVAVKTVTVVPGQVFFVTVGAGGIGGAFAGFAVANAGDGTSGGDSVFESWTWRRAGSSDFNYSLALI